MSYLFNSFLFICIINLLFNSGSYAKEISPEQKEVIQSLFEEGYGTIVISGKVVDEKGEPLKNVIVEVDRTYLSMKVMKRTRKDYTVDSVFNYKFDNTANVRLKFYKDNYYAVNYLDYQYGKPAANVRKEGDSCFYDNLMVVMKTRGKLARLDGYGMEFEVPDGRGSVYDFTNLKAKQTEQTVLKSDNKPVHSNVNIRKKPKLNKFTSNIFELQNTPRMYAKIVKNDIPENQKRRQKLDSKLLGYDAKEYNFYDDVALQIEVKDLEDCGFIIFDDSTTKGKFKSPSIAMSEAPENGYSPILKFEPAEFWPIQKELYFFCKINGLYGKGYITLVDYNDKRGARCTMYLNLQPDGSRNLETDN